MFFVLCPRHVLEDRVVLGHLFEKCLGLPEEWLADLRKEWTGEHPRSTQFTLVATYSEHDHRPTIQKDGTVVWAVLQGNHEGFYGRQPGKVPDLVHVLLTHGLAEFTHIGQGGYPDLNVRRPDCA